VGVGVPSGLEKLGEGLNIWGKSQVNPRERECIPSERRSHIFDWAEEDAAFTIGGIS